MNYSQLIALFVKRKVEESPRVVTPAHAGVQKKAANGKKLDSGLRRNDGRRGFFISSPT